MKINKKSLFMIAINLVIVASAVVAFTSGIRVEGP
jgi:hypothetical protein